MKSFKIIIFTAIASLVFPTSLYAAASFGSLQDLANTLSGGVIASLGYLMLTLAVVAFFWGIVQFIWAARNGDAGKGVQNGKQFMLWGLIALFVMFSVWGIITFAQGILGIRGETSIVIPNIQLLGSSPSPDQSSNLGNAPAVQNQNCSGLTEVQRNACLAAQGGNPSTSSGAGTTNNSGCVSPQVQGTSGCVNIGGACTKAVLENGSSVIKTGQYDQNGQCISPSSGGGSTGSW